MSTLRIARQLCAVLQPLTGVRSAGNVTIQALTSPVPVPKNTYLIPAIASPSGATQIAPDMLFRTDADATVTSTGVSVPVTSVLGGARFNVPAGLFYFHPSVAGVAATCSSSSPMAGGTDITGPAAVARVAIYEQIGGANAMKDLFAAKLGAFPALVVVWDDTTSGEFLGPNIFLRPDAWTIFAVVSRFDAGELRAADGLVLLDAVEELILRRSAVDDATFTSKGVWVTGRKRMAITPSVYVYSISFQTWAGTLQREVRPSTDFPTWIKTKYGLVTTPPDGTLNPPSVTVVDDATYNQATPPPPFPPP